MLNTAKGALAAYQNANIMFSSAPVALYDLDGTNVGYIEQINFHGDRVRISGWCLLDNLSLVSDYQHKRVRRRIHRGDVVSVLGEANMLASGNREGCVGFSSEISWQGGTVSFCSAQRAGLIQWQVPTPSHAQVKAARRLAYLSFAAKAIKSVPLIASYFALGKRAGHKNELIKRLGLLPPVSSGKELSEQFYLPAGRRNSREGITIIMPVYNAFELLEESLSRIELNTDLPWHLILVEDASPDERVRPWLREWARTRENQVTLLENKANLGFIGSVNRGFAEATKREGHIVLFNSDAFVPAGWASRLLHPILEDPLVASVTPMSNDATIFSIPSITETIQIRQGAVDVIDAVAACMTSHAKAVTPTGVGFCMAINRTALERVPTLDLAFGRGYGEEVDWCQKTRQAGMFHVGIGNLFVEHRGGQSFGSEAKMKSLAESARLITARYPNFDHEVQAFIQDDPLFTARFALALAYASTLDDGPLPIYLAHSLGGGAEHWMKEIVRTRELEGRPTVIIRVGGESRFSVELHLNGNCIVADTESRRVVEKILRHQPHRHVIYSCGVGDSHPLEIPDMLCEITGQKQGTLEVLFHDYFPISPSYNLLDSTGTFRGVPGVNCTDVAHLPTLKDGSVGTLEEWRSKWTVLVNKADIVTVFSENSREIVADAWPQVASKIQVSPHSLIHNIPKLPSPVHIEGKKAALAVLGSIGEVKGARLVSELAWYLQENGSPFNLVVLGKFDRRFSLPENVTVTGEYQLADLEVLCRQHNIAAWWMSSIWPETFSFTTHEMLSTGLPVIAFSVGAQGDAVGGHANGHIVEMCPEAVFRTAAKLLQVETPMGSASMDHTTALVKQRNRSVG